MQNLSVFRYQSAVDFLRDSIAEKKRSDSNFSVRKFCKQTNFGSHAYLVMILRRQRQLNMKHVASLSEGLNLNSVERVFFQTLIQLENAKNEEEKNLFKLWLNDLNPKAEYKSLEVEHYHVIADWVHMAILALVKIDGAKITPENVYQLIQQKTSLAQVRKAMERLVELNLLKMKDGILSLTYQSITTKDDLTNKGAREYHRQVSQLAIESLENQDPSIREFQSFALCVPKGRIPLAKDLIRKFRHQLVQLMESEPGHEVYQCNLQFFKLAESPSTLPPERKANDSQLKTSECSSVHP